GQNGRAAHAIALNHRDIGSEPSRNERGLVAAWSATNDRHLSHEAILPHPTAAENHGRSPIGLQNRRLTPWTPRTRHSSQRQSCANSSAIRQRHGTLHS